MHHVITLDIVLKQCVADVSTLAQFHCSTCHYLRALCFTNHSVAITCLAPYYLAEAQFVSRSSWRVRGLRHDQGQVWTFTTKGHDLLKRYLPLVPPLARIDLGRPSTALEHEEWRIRILVRSFLVQLVLAARRAPLLCALVIHLPGTQTWPSTLSEVSQPEPDAIVTIVSELARRHSPDWLPWVESEPLPTGAVRYPIFIERMHAHADIAELSSTWATIPASTPHIPLMILPNEERYATTR